MQRQYLCIDLKSFYASVECVQRGLDPMTAKLVVADPDRSKNTICLAVSPALKALGVKNRCRLGDIPADLKYIVAKPRMKLYIERSADVYGVYLKYFSKDDIHVYSVDEAFIDATNYLTLYNMTARELAQTVMADVQATTGLRASCGVGTNLYLTKIALDITAKHSPEFIGELNEESYRQTLWDHRPLTDFWRIGPGISSRLARGGIFTMRDIAESDENVLYNLFGKDAELLIDHAWGRESATIADIKAYQSKTHSLSSGQVLMRGYNCEEGLLIVKEMTELLCLDMTEKELVTHSVSLYLGYSGKSSVTAVKGSVSLAADTNLNNIIIPAVTGLYLRITDRRCQLRRVNVCFNDVAPEQNIQMTLFDDAVKNAKNREIQRTMLRIKDRYGRNAVFKGMDLDKAATTQERNRQIGGHRSGE
ncbi:MAG: DNA repair protein [Clostridia bacterium]|nr:DNA repair protein [Clostridia bacterium]